MRRQQATGSSPITRFTPIVQLVQSCRVDASLSKKHLTSRAPRGRWIRWPLCSMEAAILNGSRPVLVEKGNCGHSVGIQALWAEERIRGWWGGGGSEREVGGSNKRATAERNKIGEEWGEKKEGGAFITFNGFGRRNSSQKKATQGKRREKTSKANGAVGGGKKWQRIPSFSTQFFCYSSTFEHLFDNWKTRVRKRDENKLAKFEEKRKIQEKRGKAGLSLSTWREAASQILISRGKSVFNGVVGVHRGYTWTLN